MAKKNKTKKQWFNNVARVVKGKKGNYFMVFARRTDKNGNPVGPNPYPLTINEGDIFPLRLKKDDLAGLVEEGLMDQETADRICEHVKFEMNIPPRDEEESISSKSKKKAATKSDEDDEEVDF